MELLYWFASIRTPFWDAVMSFVTHLGEETAFLTVALAVFWCVDKRRGYYLLMVGFVGTVCNQFLKIMVRAPRPWVRDPGFPIVEDARMQAGGYSFPSGHTQCAVGYLGGIARFTQWLWVRLLALALAAMVAVSRLYLGVHTPADVGTSLVLAAAMVFLLYPLVESILWFPSRMYGVLGGMVGISVAFVLFMERYPFPVGTEYLAGTLKNAYSLTGASAGMLAVYALDTRWVRFSTKAAWWGQAVKLAAGLVLVTAVKVLLKAPLDTLCGGHPAAHALRYFLVTLTAGSVWPLTFRFLGRRKSSRHSL